MKIKLISLLLISLLGSKLLAQGENIETSISNDSLNLKYSKRIQLLMANPNTPSKAAFYSSIIPGLGQAYIGKAWKIPFIYAALGASLYYFDLNNKEMSSYRTAYKRRLNGFFDDEYLELARPITTEQLLLGMDFHKNYRDIAIALAALTYMLNILDASVSAHLLQFNVNEDLSISPNLFMNNDITGLQIALKF